ncbi:MAG TPA: carboxypeptidase regulatory-like domain-containing protein [Thermoanaerobaculia bacterium]|nr:carboxypeptidase regulatory-like domain-containing protein [Thermoanaerobaculia bacterium]
MKNINALLLLLLLTVVACDSPTDISLPSGVPGIVVSAQTNSPVEGATVTIAGKSSVTPASGRFFFFDIPKAEHNITVTKPGYATYEARVAINSASDLRIALVPQS